MINQEAENLRRAIENLMNAKLQDALRPDGLGRLLAHRATGVASVDIRSAERRLEELLRDVPVMGLKPNHGAMAASRRMN